MSELSDIQRIEKKFTEDRKCSHCKSVFRYPQIHRSSLIRQEDYYNHVGTEYVRHPVPSREPNDTITYTTVCPHCFKDIHTSDESNLLLDFYRCTLPYRLFESKIWCDRCGTTHNPIVCDLTPEFEYRIGTYPIHIICRFCGMHLFSADDMEDAVMKWSDRTDEWRRKHDEY